MAQHLVIDDFTASGVSYTSGTILDDAHVLTAPLEAAGLAIIPWVAGGALEAARAAYLDQRGARPAEAAPPVFVAILAARGLLP